MIFKDYYSILGVLPQATQREIAIAYKIMAKKWHPDKNQADDTTLQMQLISVAYGVLKNKEKRKAYNTEYYNYYHSQIQNNQGTKVRIEKCYYCDENIANNKFLYSEEFYKEIGRSHFPQRKVRYDTVNVEVPRCEECYNTHNSGAGIFLFLPLIAFAILGLILGLTIWGLWLLFLIVGGIAGAIIGALLSSMDHSFIAKEAGIRKESDISDFTLVAKLSKEGWTKYEPTA